jgi:phage-related protein
MTSGGKDVIENYINQLPKDEKAAAYDVLVTLKNGELENLNTRQFNSKIWEIKFYQNNRLFYLIYDERTVYILHACKKQKNKTENFIKQLVLKRAGDILRKPE